MRRRDEEEVEQLEKREVTRLEATLLFENSRVSSETKGKNGRTTDTKGEGITGTRKE